MKHNFGKVIAIILILVTGSWFLLGNQANRTTEENIKAPTPLVINTKDTLPVEKNDIGVITVIDENQQMVFQYRGAFHSWEAADRNTYVVLELHNDVLQ